MMTAAPRIPTVDSMPKIFHRHRDHYLEQLAAEALFQGVPKHLIVVIARSVDVLRLHPNSSTPCDPARETIFIVQGDALLADGYQRPLAFIGAGAIIGHPHRDETTAAERINAITSLFAYVIARRELQTVTKIAPHVADALTREDVTRTNGDSFELPVARSSRSLSDRPSRLGSG
jgi:hypothetical protein